MCSLVFNCQRSINNINFFPCSAVPALSRREFSQMLLLGRESADKVGVLFLHASRTVNFPDREKLGVKEPAIRWRLWSGTKRLLTWHLKRQMLQGHFTLSMCSVLALLPRQNFLSLLSQPGSESWLKFSCFKGDNFCAGYC